MAKLHLLGTGGAFNAPNRTTTMLAFTGETDGTVVVDCGADVVQQMAKCGLDTHKIKALIVTHEHADHCTAFPLFIEKLWLSGRSEPFDIYAVPAVIAILQQMQQMFKMAEWHNLSPIRYHAIDLLTPNVHLLETADFSITGNKVVHPVPTVGLNVLVKSTQKRITYSCDTAPCDVVAEMAQNADILIHEATSEETCPAEVHTSFADAATVAQKAQAKVLVLVHLPVFIPETEIQAAKSIYKGELFIGEDGMCFEI